MGGRVGAWLHSRFRQWLALTTPQSLIPTTTAQREYLRKSRLLSTLLLAALLIAVPMAVLYTIAPWSMLTWCMWLYDGLTAVALVLNRRGNVQSAAMYFLFVEMAVIFGVEWVHPLVGYSNALWRGVGLGIIPLTAGLFLPFWTSFLFAAAECLLVTGSFLMMQLPQPLNDTITILFNVYVIAITFAVIGAAYAASTTKAVMQADRTAEIEQAHADLAVAYTKLEALATTDPITGALNHRAFSEHLIRAVTTARNDHAPLGVIFADVDHFKQVNDTWGHQTGDAVLAHLASLLRQIAGDIGILARYGGEEFVMLLPGHHQDQSAVFAERARSLVAGSPLALPEGKQIAITASFGVAAFPFDGITPEALLKAADLAMYQAKTTGRNRVCSARDLIPVADAA